MKLDYRVVRQNGLIVSTARYSISPSLRSLRKDENMCSRLLSISGKDQCETNGFDLNFLAVLRDYN